jgi:hypothetical protein
VTDTQPSLTLQQGAPTSWLADRALWLTEAALAALLFAILLGPRDLPLVDLPQHAWQLTSWLRIDAHDPAVTDLELNFRTPYLLAYPVARLLAVFLPVVTALKLTFGASVALQAITLRRLCQKLGHDPWLGLLGFPLGLGYSFCWGFVAFCAALPLANMAFAQVERHRLEPSFRSAGLLALTLSLLLVAHGVAFGFLLAVLAPLLLFGRGTWWLRLLPLLGPPLLAAVWLVPGRTSTRLGGDLWRFEPERLLELPGELVGIGSVDRWSSLLGVLLILALVLSVGRLRSIWLAYPLAASLFGYMFFPTMFRGAGPLGPRFACYLVPAVLLAFAPREAKTPLPLIGRGLALFVAGAVPLLFAWRLVSFNRDMDGLRAIIDRLPAGLSLRPIVFERGGRAFPGTPGFLHVPAYYAVEKDGSAGYSFAMYSISVVRLRPGVPIRMGGGMEWMPELFDAEREAFDYDYFLVKSSVDRTAELFPGPAPRAELDVHIGDWWGYRRASERE